MSEIKQTDGGLAFPQYQPGKVFDRTEVVGGMTLRDYFAAAAMQGLIREGRSPVSDVVAGWSYQLADAMLKARTNGKTN